MRYRIGLVACLLAASAVRAAEVPDEFKDPETGARIVHISRVPDADRAGVIYFTQGTATADSKRVLFHTTTDNDKAKRHLYTFDLTTGQVTPIVTDRMTAGQDFSPRSNNVYYQADHGIWSANIDTKQARKIADLPADWATNTDLSVNADETLLASGTDASGASAQPATAPADANVPAETARLKAMGGTFEAHRKNVLYTVDLKSGEVKVIHEINTWLGHVQFSPTDPKLLMFCHEGPWGKVDRIWTVRIGENEPSIFYKRTDPNEIAGHEIFGPDGKAIWFQDSIRGAGGGGGAWLAGKDVTTGELTKYRQPEGGGGIHQFQSFDGKFFIGDGGGKSANGPGKYMTLQEPDGNGGLKVTKLCSLQKNDYSQCEPNPHLTPDQHWLVFTATFDGPPRAYAMEMPEKYWRK